MPRESCLVSMEMRKKKLFSSTNLLTVIVKAVLANPF